MDGQQDTVHNLCSAFPISCLKHHMPTASLMHHSTPLNSDLCTQTEAAHFWQMHAHGHHHALPTHSHPLLTRVAPGGMHSTGACWGCQGSGAASSPCCRCWT